MNTEVVKEWLLQQIEEGKQDKMPPAVKEYLDQNQGLSEEIKGLQTIWQKLEDISTPLPSQKMHDGFYKMLATQKQKEDRRFGVLWQKWWTNLNTFELKPQHVVFASLIVLGGFFLGRMSNPNHHQIDVLTQEVQQMREMMMLTLIEQPSVGKRLQAVNMTQELENVDDKIIQALFTTLLNDPNVNVRLVTIDALLNFSDQPKVREGLIEAIAQQQSPMIQLALAEAMIILKEKRSVPQLEALIESDTVEVEIKEQLENMVQLLM